MGTSRTREQKKERLRLLRLQTEAVPRRQRHAACVLRIYVSHVENDSAKTASVQ